MGDPLVLWIHLLAVSIWIGPQVFLFAAAIPAMRTIEDVHERTRLTRIIVTRFSYLAFGALAVILITGIINIYQVDGYSVSDLLKGDAEIRWTRIFWEKMSMVGVAVVLTLIHVLFVGPRQLDLADRADADPYEARNIRRLSITISGIGLIASLAALFLGAELGHHEYSFQLN
jgi:uncharacterized membrane protein